MPEIQKFAWECSFVNFHGEERLKKIVATVSFEVEEVASSACLVGGMEDDPLGTESTWYWRIGYKAPDGSMTMAKYLRPELPLSDALDGAEGFLRGHSDVILSLEETSKRKKANLSSV